MKPEKPAGKGGKPKSKDLLGSLFAKKESKAAGHGSSLAMKNAAEGLKNINHMLMSLVGTPRGSMNVNPNPITDVYKISSNVLGLGINGKVVECFDSAGEKYALKVSQILSLAKSNNYPVKSNSYSSPVLTFPLLLIFLLTPSGEKREGSCANNLHIHTVHYYLSVSPSFPISSSSLITFDVSF